ncbi:MAG: peptide chain release factor N(5)-glutamine methyltransferase, partial [Mariprofundaceae bacterium]
ALSQASQKLQQAGCDTPGLDANVLLRHAWRNSSADIIIALNEELPADVEQAYAKAIARRAVREPLAYITGEKEFWSLSFLVTPDVLIPRPETEHLIEAVIAYFPDRRMAHHFCDVGTGSACVAVTLAREYPASTVFATDVSAKALSMAQKNAARHGVAERIIFRQGDMFDAMRADNSPFDAIISNPPYVSLGEMDALAPELGHEPRAALTDEADGRRYLQVLVEASAPWLKPQGLLIVETGLTGLPAGNARLKHIQTMPDLAGHQRVGVYRRV